MASLRQKTSKIPIKVESRGQNISKIPLRVETKPKFLTNNEVGSERPCTAITKKASINPADKNKKYKKEIPKKELKSVSVQPRSKVKQNIYQPSEKISQKKTTIHDKEIPKKELKSVSVQPKSKVKQNIVSQPSKKISQNKTTFHAKEIPKKELKPISKQLKSKMKGNVYQPSEKIRLVPRSIVINNGQKTSNSVSQALKDRNKITVTEVSEKPKFVKSKAKENPYDVFEKKIPEVNLLDDDPFQTCAKENKIEQSNQQLPQDIEFVADEKMKNFILSNRELTPRILKSYTGVQIASATERPSLYKRPNFSCNAYEQAFKDIANCDLALEERRVSQMKKNGLFRTPLNTDRPSLYKRSHFSCNAYEQAFKDIANSDLALEDRRVSQMQKNKLFSSPLQNRNSLYKPLKSVVDPYQDALKSLAELRMHRKVKSCKKVTFKLSDGDRSSETKTKDETTEEKPVEMNQPRLTDISEKSSTSSTQLTPEFEGILLTPSRNPSTKITVNSPSKSNEILVQNNETCVPKEIEKQESEFLKNGTCAPISSILKTVANVEKNVHGLSPILCLRQNSDDNAATFSHQIKNSVLKTVNTFLYLPKTSETRHSMLSNQAEHYLDKMNKKIFTPQPVSLYPRINQYENISPEFLSTKTTDILSCAPMNTPMVLKSLGQQEKSPVCKKLEFQDSPKEINKEQNNSKENSQTFNLQHIMTQQKILDQLAHQECTILMDEAEFPCEIREYLQNPIAQILEYGDETHFVPLWRLS